MPNLPLQDMIAGVIKTANAKLAAEEPREPEKVKKLLAFEKKEHGGHLPTVEEEKDECAKMASAQLCSSDHVEKLASAVEYLSSHLGDIEAPGPIAQAMAKMAMKPGAGGGSAGGKSTPNPSSSAGALQTTQAIGGSQKYTKNKAKGEQAEDEHNKALSSARAHDGKTQLDNNMHDAPGNNGGAVPKTEYPKKGPFVAGPSGAHDKGKNGATKTAGMESVIAKGMTNHPRATAAAIGGLGYGIPGAIGGAAGAEDGHRLKGALKGGLTTGAVGAGVTGLMAHKAGLHTPAAKKAMSEGFARSGIKVASADDIARQHILMKLAGEDVMKSNIEGGGTVSPLAGKGQLKTMKAGETSPMQGGGSVGGGEAGGAGLIGSNKGAIDYTKKDAKKLVVDPLKAALDQPAFSKKHDNKLEENLRNTGKAGVKIAGVTAQLQKIASAGCTCNSKGECQFCTMTSKLANMGMSQMADAGEGSDGCTCGHTGECRVCKLNAAMHAAKGGHTGHAAGSV
jgi:hypothetical protein